MTRCTKQAASLIKSGHPFFFAALWVWVTTTGLLIDSVSSCIWWLTGWLPHAMHSLAFTTSWVVFNFGSVLSSMINDRGTILNMETLQASTLRQRARQQMTIFHARCVLFSWSNSPELFWSRKFAIYEVDGVARRSTNRHNLQVIFLFRTLLAALKLETRKKILSFRRCVDSRPLPFGFRDNFELQMIEIGCLIMFASLTQCSTLALTD